MAALVATAACTDKDVARGDRLAGEHRWTEAMGAYKAALARYPRNYDAAWGITKIYCFAMHVPKKCIAWSRRLLEIYPDNKDYQRAAQTGFEDLARESEEPKPEP